MLFASSRVDGPWVFSPGPNGFNLPYDAPADSGWCDPAYVDSFIRVGFQACQLEAHARNAAGALTSVTAGHSFNWHIHWVSERAVTNGPPIVMLVDSSGQGWLRLIGPGDGTCHLQNWNGSAWVDVPGGISANFNNIALDLAVNIDAGGNHSVLFAVGNSTVFYGVVSMPGMSNLAAAYMYPIDPGRDSGFSEVMLSQDIGLVNGHLKTIRPNGAGVWADWSGAYTDVNEVVTNDATSNKTDTVGAKQSYTMGDVTVPAGYAIAGVFHRFRIKNDGTAAPLNAKALARSGGADYLSVDLPGVAPAFGPTGTRYDVDPATGLAWTEAGVNALELGFQADT